MSNGLPMPNRSLSHLLYSAGFPLCRSKQAIFVVQCRLRSVAMNLVRITCVLIVYVLLLNAVPLFAQDLPKDYQEVLTFLGRTGDFKAKVLKVNIPRNDLHVTIAGQSTPTPFVFRGRVPITKGHRSPQPLTGL